MLGKIEGKMKRVAEDEWLDSIADYNGYESEQTLGDGEGQGSLVCCSPWGIRYNLATEQQLA